jgi:putative ATP-dependent endonuclease of OLD family
VIVTTHSPHIVSVTPPQALVVLRGGDGTSTVGVAAAADLEPAEWADIERYLDATRGELVFARRVLLVEGFAEAVLLPKLARDAGLDLDKAGVTVCAIHGTHFGTYARYLTALGTPWSVVTDGDPKKSKEAAPDEPAEADGEQTDEIDSELVGEIRARRLLEYLGHEGTPAEHGIFVGDATLELDLFYVSDANRELCLRVLGDYEWANPTATKIKGWADGADVPPTQYMRIVTRIGKGRYSQRLAAQQPSLDAPGYVASALQYLLS